MQSESDSQKNFCRLEVINEKSRGGKFAHLLVKIELNSSSHDLFDNQLWLLRDFLLHILCLHLVSSNFAKEPVII